MTARRTGQGVTISGLYKSFGTHPVLIGIDLEIAAGSISAVLGPSGSGKTTLLRLLAGFATPDEGTITIGGRMVDGPGQHIRPESRQIGYVPQEGSLFPHLDVKANIGFGVPRARRRARVAELLEMTELTGLANRYPHQLSGGQQQRVALARALASDPSVVLLDEPFSSLDAALRTSVRHDVAEILRAAGTTTVIVTHDQDEALSLADQVSVLRHGRVAQTGSPHEIYDHPVDTDLARFVGEANLITGTMRDGAVDTILGTLPVANGKSEPAASGQAVVLVRPEQIELVPAGSSGATTGQVVSCDYHGHDSLVSVRTDRGNGEAVNARMVGTAELAEGAAVWLRVVGPVRVWAAGEP